ncbi:hypothetical protein [Allosphingosinicella deserti]|uniref:Uncharacterized protein n=1 Tax=Allosphingosinicella deserti TaxID=2116704 RepID=A0A2P7QZS3_9SPHN|nr:hypothetical protein [Sphingomonas deserti]PSJ43467.1 hypothetical protein C7I55_03685 [Sphingomonas deserti]
MTRVKTRLFLGFGAGALSHLFFQGALGTMLHWAGLLPELIWSLEPVPPLAVPTTVNNMFWDGLWGMAYGLVEPRLTALLGRPASGLALGFASLLVFWLVVLPLKGSGLAGLDIIEISIDVAFDLVFGLGTVLLFWAGLRLRRPSPPA